MSTQHHPLISYGEGALMPDLASTTGVFALGDDNIKVEQRNDIA